MAKSKKTTKRKSRTKAKPSRTKKAVAKGLRIGIFGGTFNPIHYGHLNSIETVQKDLQLDQVWIVPAAQNPLRQISEGATPQQRAEMVKLALPLLNQGGGVFFVKENEIERGGPSYTIDTLKEFRKEARNAEFFLIIGADQLEQFDQWKDYKQILKVAHLVVTTRPAFVLPERKAEMPEWLKPLIKSFKNQRGSLTTGKKLFYVRLQDVDVSATDIRRRLRHSESVASYVPAPVAEYIKKNRIYENVGGRIGDFEKFTQFCAQLLEEKGALSVTGYDVRDLQQPTEFTLVGSGTSTRHTIALSEHIIRRVKEEYGVHPQGTEGFNEGRWIVLDYGSLMIHLFYDYVRNEYRIEDLWREGRPLRIANG